MKNKRKITEIMVAAALICAAAGIFCFHTAAAKGAEGNISVSGGDVSEGDVSTGDVSGGDISTGDVSTGNGPAGENYAGSAGSVSDREASEDMTAQNGAALEDALEEEPGAGLIDGIPVEELAFADVDDYINIRSGAGTDYPVIGKLYDGGAARVMGEADENGEWFHIVSGSLDGYAKAEFFLYGEEAEGIAESFVKCTAMVQADRPNIREAPDVEARRTGFADQGSVLEVLEDCGDWLRIRSADGTEGYVAAEYVVVTRELTYAKSLEEERAEREAARAAAEEAASRNEDTQSAASYTPPEITGYESAEELRAAIVEYAMQYLGNSYVHGGSSLAAGTDCSGFTCFIYADFGYSISRTPSGQLSSAGRSIDYSEIQPGDIICYTSNGGRSCTHVGLYIGDGQIIHSANSRKGVIISEADYSTIMGVKNVID